LLTELLQTIKRAAVEAVEAGVPSAPFVGTVVEIEPLQVRLNQRLTLSGNRLLFLEEAEEVAMEDRLALLRFVGGQQYLVLGRLQ